MVPADEALTQPLSCADIQVLATALGRPASTLYALSHSHDPFYITEGRETLARWFAEIIWPLAPEGTIHLRRLHYLVASLPPDQRPQKLNGLPYENTHEDWRTLNIASVDARALNLIDAGRLTDRRAGEPAVVHIPHDQESDADVFIFGGQVTRPTQTTTPFFHYRPQDYAFPTVPRYAVSGPTIIEPYAIEVWAEKSTMNDVLMPLARRHGFTLITGVGELSWTHCHWLIDRASEHERKTRILYISDFDPAGDDMLVSIARKVEFLLRREGLDLDIRLDPLVLTRDQVERYALPRIPIKDSDPRKGHFEARHGAGAVELDALEALHPGELGRILEEAIEVYREPTQAARDEIEASEEDLRDFARDIRDEVLGEHAEALAQLRTEFEAMQAAIAPHQQGLTEIGAEFEERYGARIAEAVDAINAVTEQFYEHAEEVIAAIADDLEERAPDPDEVDWPEVEDAGESDDPLFDSERGYLDQIARYKHHQGKPLQRRRRNSNSGRAP